MDKTRELLRLTKEGNEAAREQIILNNVGLIWSVVRRFTNRGYESEDLFQIGSIGLMKAVDKFDLSYDVKFSTYAVPMITGYGCDWCDLRAGAGWCTAGWRGRG